MKTKKERLPCARRAGERMEGAYVMTLEWVARRLLAARINLRSGPAFAKTVAKATSPGDG